MLWTHLNMLVLPLFIMRWISFPLIKVQLFVGRIST